MGLASSFKQLERHLVGRGAEFTEDGDKVSEASELLPSPSTKGKKYDYIATIHRLEHYGAPEKILACWWNSINPGGTLLLVLPDDRYYPRVGSAACNHEHKIDFNYDVIAKMMEKIAPVAELVERSCNDGLASFWMVYRKPGKLDPKSSVVQKTLRYFSKTPKYDVVIPVYGKHDLLHKCIDSMVAYGWTPENVIVVHDHDGEELQWHDTNPKVTVLQTRRRLGFAGAVNKGVKACKNNAIIVLNTDVVVKPDGDKKLLAALRRPSVGMVGQSGGRLDETYAYSGEGLDYIEMYACAFRKSVWDELGGLDEKFFPGYGEDSDLGIRMRKAGYTLTTVSDICTHTGGASFGKSPEIKKIIEDHRVILKEKHQKGKALFFCASSNMSGGIRVIWNFAKALREMEWDISVCFVDFRYDPKGLRKEWRDLDFNIYTEATLKDCKEDWDIVFATYQSTVPYAAKIKCKEKVFIVQSDEPEWFKPNPNSFNVAYKNFTYPGFKHIIIGDYMWSFKDKYKMNIIEKIDNGVSTLEFHQLWDLYREDIVFPPTIVTTRKGTPVWYDGVEGLDEAISRLDMKKYNDLLYLSIGRGNNPKQKVKCKYEEVITSNGSDVCVALNRGTIYCHPCKIEGSSLAVMEAMACGLPVICAKNASDVIKHGYNGIEIENGTPEEWKEAIEMLLDTPKLRELFRQRSLKIINERTLELQRKQFSKCINKLMGGKYETKI